MKMYLFSDDAKLSLISNSLNEKKLLCQTLAVIKWFISCKYKMCSSKNSDDSEKTAVLLNYTKQV